MAVSLVYETHSTTDDNEAGRATGWLPGDLSPYGREQARELGARRRNDSIAAVFCSDRRRAVQTATIAFAGSGIPVHADARLRECDYGALNGAPVADVTALRSAAVATPFPGGESYLDVVERTRSLLRDIAVAFDGRRVLLVAHSATRLALDHLLNGDPLDALVAAPFQWQAGWAYVLGRPP